MNLDRALARAKRVEDALREKAFLPLGEIINGVEVLQFSLRHLTILFKIRSPFLYGGIPQIEDVGLFLWIVSQHYNPSDNENRAAFMAQLVFHPEWERFYRSIRRYLDRALMDTPPQASEGKPISASYAAGIIHKIAAAYGWDIDRIMDTPIAALFQLMKWIEIERNFNLPQFNPLQDRVKARLIERLNS